MRSLSDTIARLKRLQIGVLDAPGTSRLKRLGEAGSNPGQLNGWIYVPENAQAGAPLVVVLHGCTQRAAGYDNSSGWSKLADEHGFVLLYPEQRRANNPNLCFNWFAVNDASRGKGEALSIREMVAAVHRSHQIDPHRVFVTGLSAGGAMAAVMLATYPDVFAGGGVIAGLPFGVAHSVPEAFDRMRGHGLPDKAELTALVRRASRHSGTWPTLSVWHGSADQTVDPADASALVAQWRGLHSVSEEPTATTRVHGYPHRMWRDKSGRVVIEEYSITGLGHGTPLDTGGAHPSERAAPFMLEAGISSTRLIARFWGIVPEGLESSRPVDEPRPSAGVEQLTRAARGSSGSPQTIANTIDAALRSAGLVK